MSATVYYDNANDDDLYADQQERIRQHKRKRNGRRNWGHTDAVLRHHPRPGLRRFTVRGYSYFQLVRGNYLLSG